MLCGGQHVNRPIFDSFKALPQRLSITTKEVRSPFNAYICIPSYPGHMLAPRSAVMAGQVSRQMRKWWEEGRGGGVWRLSCLVSSSISPPLPCCVCGCLWCCPNQASQRWHTAYCTAALHGPQSTSVPASVSLVKEGKKEISPEELTQIRRDVMIEGSFTPLLHILGYLYFFFMLSFHRHCRSLQCQQGHTSCVWDRCPF